MPINDAAARGFERGADDYERARPGYPQAVFDLLTDELPLRPRARALRPRGRHRQVHPRPAQQRGRPSWRSSPCRAMRRKLAVVCPEAEILDGTAEAHPAGRPLGRRRDRGPGVPLVRRPAGARRDPPRPPTRWRAGPGVERPRRVGRLGAPVHRAHRRALGRASLHAVPRNRAGRPGGHGRAARGDRPGRGVHPAPARHLRQLPAHRRRRRGGPRRVDELRVGLPDDRREALLAEVRHLVETHPQTAGRERFAFPHRTDVTWCHTV